MDRIGNDRVAALARAPSSAGGPPRIPLALALGVTGHRPEQLDGQAERIATRLSELLDAISAALADIAAVHAPLFAPGAPAIRLVTPLAQGADQLAACAAIAKHMAIEAVRLAFKYMSPVFYLSDGYLANGAEPWAIPEIDELPQIPVTFATDPASFMPYSRDPETLARPYAIPGTPGLEHRIGGIEKQHITGNVNYDPENHHLMVRLRQEKVDRAANDIPLIEVFGENTGKVLVLGWGSTYGSISTAVEKLQSEGKSVSSAHLRYLNPFPKNLGEVLSGFETVIIPEMNLGQLCTMVRAKYLVDAIAFSKVKGRPFQIREIVRKVEEYL